MRIPVKRTDWDAEYPADDFDDRYRPGDERLGERENGVARDDLSGCGEENGWKDRCVRLLADFENYKRHAEAERERLCGIGKEAVLDDLFPMVEHMERAIEAAHEAGPNNGILEGIEMVYKELLSVLLKHGVERLQTKGERFDPALHEAVAVVPGQGVPEGTIIKELKPGFIRNERLLRPATVVVAQ